MLHKFMKDPSKYIEGVLMGARRAPELINLLNLEQQFPHNVLKRFLTSFGASDAAVGMPKTAEMDCQVRHARACSVAPWAGRCFAMVFCDQLEGCRV